MQITKLTTFKVLILKYYESTVNGIEKYYEGRTVYAASEKVRDYLIKNSDFALKVWEINKEETKHNDVILDNKIHLN